MGVHYPGTKAEIGALGAYVKLRRAAETAGHRVQACLPAGLTLTQFGVLEALQHLGPMCQSDLAGKLLKSGGNLTLVVDNLEKAGWVVRQRNAEDRRFVTVSLTSQGRSLIARLFPSVAAEVTQGFSVLSPAEQFTLGWLCKKLGTAEKS